MGGTGLSDGRGRVAREGLCYKIAKRALNFLIR